MIPSRARHALLAGGAAALAWAAAEELAGRKTVRMTAMLAIAAGMGAMATSKPSSKAYNVEDRLNKLAPRIPVPQPSPGSASNSTYNVSNNTYNVASNASLTTLTAAYNALRNDYSLVIPAFNTLRNDHSNLLNNHNQAIQTLRSANVFQ